MISTIVDNGQCTGCMKCQYLCKVGAITFKNNEEGFLIPIVDNKSCISCGNCLKNCSVNDVLKKEPVKILAARNKDANYLEKCSSGAIFPALARYVFEKNGKVIATQMNEQGDLEFAVAENMNQISNMLGSKYVQSYIGKNYSVIEKLLSEGIVILFVGTPCQVNAVRGLFGSVENLILVDLVCHGVPSPRVWSDYISIIQNKYGKKIRNINFRDKANGWNSSFASAYIDKKKISLQNYMMLYGVEAMIRESCYQCQFTTLQRCSDLTIGDFWGIEQILPKWFNNKLGTSMILLNTDKGKVVVKGIEAYIDMEEITGSVQLQLNLRQPTRRPKCRDEFWRMYREQGIISILKRYGGWGIYGRIRKLLGKIKRAIFH